MIAAECHLVGYAGRSLVLIDRVCIDPVYSSPILCISPWSAGQEIDDGQANTSIARLNTVHATFNVFTANLLAL